MNSVLDASAFLAYLHGEPGAGHVTNALAHVCAMSAANWAETLSKLAELGQDPDQVALHLTQQGLLGTALVIYSLDETQAREIAKLRPLTRSAGLSLGDRACLALARRLSLPAITADHSWASLQLGIPIRLIR